MADSPLELAQRLRIATDALRRTVRARRQLDGVARKHEAVLDLLRRKGALTTAELARWEQITPQSMGATVAELVARGWVGKTSDPYDGRREPVGLTAAGQLTLTAIARQRDSDLAELLGDRLSAAERRTISDALGLLESLSASTSKSD